MLEGVAWVAQTISPALRLWWRWLLREFECCKQNYKMPRIYRDIPRFSKMHRDFADFLPWFSYSPNYNMVLTIMRLGPQHPTTVQQLACRLAVYFLPFIVQWLAECWGLAAGYQLRPQVVDRGTTARYGGQLRYIYIYIYKSSREPCIWAAGRASGL